MASELKEFYYLDKQGIKIPIDAEDVKIFNSAVLELKEEGYGTSLDELCQIWEEHSTELLSGWIIPSVGAIKSLYLQYIKPCSNCGKNNIYKAFHTNGKLCLKCEETNTTPSVIKTDEEIQKEIDELNKQLELKTKELEKQKKQQKKLAYKQLKKHHSLRWRALCETVDAESWTINDINLFCKYEPTITTTLENIKTKELEKEKEEAYKAIINRKEPLIDDLLKKVQEEYKSILEEEQRTYQTRAYTEREITLKMNRLEKIQTRISYTECILNDLITAKENLEPKKKRGRPTKAEKIAKELQNTNE